MPPEQASGKLDQIKETADVYSLGATLYALLIGRPPFQADNPLDTLLQVLHDEAVALRQFNAQLPRDLETICRKCLEKDPSRRYPSAQAVAAELRRWLAGHPIHARRVGRLARGVRWCQRNPVVAGLMASSILLFVVVTVVGLVGYLRTSAATGRARSEFHKRAESLVDSVLTAQPDGVPYAIERLEPLQEPVALFWKAGVFRAQARAQARLREGGSRNRASSLRESMGPSSGFRDFSTN